MFKTVLSVARWAELRDTLEALLDKAPDARAAALAERRKTHPEEAEELARLLKAADATAWDAQMAGAAAADVAIELGRQLDAAADLTGSRIGAWHLQRLVGQGGMGSVYLAARSDGAYDQQAALKVVTGRTLSSSAGERFVRERQILARLEHPGIARLLDGGLTEDGWPYMVMEYVDGVDLLSYAQANTLSERARLALFEDLLTVVQFAHRNLIVHGDLKPDNVLVTQPGALKLVDFGIARALDDAEGSTSVALTPAYASPERLDGEPLTPGADIYALGVLLHRLLTPQAPYDLDGIAPTERADFIRQHLDRDADREAPLANCNRELAAICRQAMAPSPSARYGSVEQLRRDIAGFYAHQPVQAFDGSRGYRLRKFLRRHRFGLGAAGLIALTVAGGTAAALVQADRARAQAERAEQVSSFLASLFNAANPFGTWQEEPSLRDLLEDADARATAELQGDPEVQAQIQAMLAEAFMGIGAYERAVGIYRSALNASRRAHGEDSLEVARARSQLAHALIENGDYETAAAQAGDALQRLQAAGPEHRIGLADATTNLAVAVSSLGDAERANRLHQQALRLRQQLLPANHVSIADSKMSLAAVRLKLGQRDQILPLNKAARDIYLEHYGPDHPMTLRARNGVASSAFLAGDYAAAAEAFGALIANAAGRLGPDHPELALLYNNRGRALMELGHFHDAARAYREAAQRVSAAPDQRLLSISARFNQGVLHSELGAFETALPQLRAAATGMTDLVGADHPLSYRTAIALAQSEALAGITQAPDALLALIADPRAGQQPAWRARAQASLAWHELSRGQSVQATTQLSAAAPILEAELAEDSWRAIELRLLAAAVAGDESELGAQAGYLIGRLPAESVRRQRAEGLLRSAPGVVSQQPAKGQPAF